MKNIIIILWLKTYDTEQLFFRWVIGVKTFDLHAAGLQIYITYYFSQVWLESRKEKAKKKEEKRSKQTQFVYLHTFRIKIYSFF